MPPGLDRLPGPGEVAVSPAMRRLLESTPDDQLDDRYPGRVTLTIGAAGLAHHDELVAIIGRTPDQLGEVRSVQGPGLRHAPSGYAFFFVMRMLLLKGAVLVLVPVVILIVTVSRVAAAQREQRLAAIRLVGATRLQTAAVAAAETGIAAVAGSALAWAAYEAGRRVVAETVIFQGGHFCLEDVAVPPAPGLVLVGAPALVMLTTIVSLRRVQDSPLGISRRPPPAALGLARAAPRRRHRRSARHWPLRRASTAGPARPSTTCAAVRHPHDRRLRAHRAVAVHARRSRDRPRQPGGARADRGPPHRQ